MLGIGKGMFIGLIRKATLLIYAENVSLRILEL